MTDNYRQDEIENSELQPSDDIDAEIGFSEVERDDTAERSDTNSFDTETDKQ